MEELQQKMREFNQSSYKNKRLLYQKLLTDYTLQNTQIIILMRKVADYQQDELERDVRSFMMNENVQRL